MPLHFGFLVFPGVQQLDLTGPYEIFASVPEAEVHLIWKDRSPVVSATGLVLTPTTTLAECPRLGLLCVPGGRGVNALLTDGEVLAFLRLQAERTRYVSSVCTGALVLGAAGLLKGRRATTHWASHDLLAKFGAIPTKGRVVRDAYLFTAGGVTAGIDFALVVVAELLGEAHAQAIQLGHEYAPEPPFRCGTPEDASATVLAEAKARFAETRRERERIIEAISAEKTFEAAG